MIVRYLSLQDKFDPMNGQKIEQSDKLSELLHRRRNLRPFAAWLTGENGFQIAFGISTDRCCARYSRADGSPPYLNLKVQKRQVRILYAPYGQTIVFISHAQEGFAPRTTACLSAR